MTQTIRKGDHLRCILEEAHAIFGDTVTPTPRRAGVGSDQSEKETP
jgi:hypothetical protein